MRIDAGTKVDFPFWLRFPFLSLSSKVERNTPRTPEIDKYRNGIIEFNPA